ncbi:MAG: D-glycero-beta-D-manno-heptose 1,7-bisphosphate 7-phosphatase [Aliiglaciecola sp.]
MTKALFLDRDGIINVDNGYVYQAQNFQFFDAIFPLCQRFQDAGFLIIVVTNQSGIGRGYYSSEQFLQLNEWMVEQFNDKGIKISDTYFCPHHPNHGVGEYRTACSCRKPNPGMFQQAQKKYQIDMDSSVMIGDRMSDMKASEAAGVSHRFLLLNSKHQPDDSATYQTITQLEDAADLFFEPG